MSRHHLGGVRVVLSYARLCPTAVDGEVKQTGRHLPGAIRFTAGGGGSALITVLFGQRGRPKWVSCIRVYIINKGQRLSRNDLNAVVSPASRRPRQIDGVAPRSARLFHHSHSLTCQDSRKKAVDAGCLKKALISGAVFPVCHQC